MAQRIRALLGTKYTERNGDERGLTPGDFAILMRSTRSKEQDGTPRHKAFTDALRVAGIEYSLEAGGGVFDLPEVEVLREAFRTLRNGNPDRPSVDAYYETSVKPSYPNADLNQLRRVFSNWGRLIHAPITGSRRRIYPQNLVLDLLTAFGVGSNPPSADTMRNLGVFSRIIKDVETVYPSVDSTDRFQSIVNFLENEAELGYDADPADEILQRPDAVMVSTVHKAKGLEFPVVFVVDVEAQRFPGRNRSYDGWLPRALIGTGLGRGAYQSTVEEETRLFYTAITRAERYLYVSGAAQLPNGGPRRPSSFAQALQHSELSTDPAGVPDGIEPFPARRRIDETVVPTTFSEIRYYLSCPKDYQFRKIYGFAPPIKETFGFGQSVHTIVGKLHQDFPTTAPTSAEAEALAEEVFHLKHVPKSNDPANRPGVYEQGQGVAKGIAKDYVDDYREDFERKREVEARFEIPAQNTVISGSIDLLVEMDEHQHFKDAEVIDFKTQKGSGDPELDPLLHWTELALQVQLYAKGAADALRKDADAGSIHLLRHKRRVAVPVTPAAIDAAVANVEWAVQRILAEDFPMRPKLGPKADGGKCETCDFQSLCSKTPQAFRIADTPPPIHLPDAMGTQMARAFSEYDG